MTTWPYPAPEDDGAASHLVPGVLLPAASLPATTGGEMDPSAIPGRAILVIYPWTGRPGLANPPRWDDIPGAHGSTPELEGFRDHAVEFTARGVRLLAMSGQTREHQSELAGRLGLDFPILSDAGLRFADALGLPRFETGGVHYLRRLTLELRDGAIARVFYPVHPPDAHAIEVLAAIEAGPRPG